MLYIYIILRVLCFFKLIKYYYFRSLRCHRTRIHRNLFLAIIIHVIIRLMMHADQMVARSAGGVIGGSTMDSIGTITNTVNIKDSKFSIPVFQWISTLAGTISYNSYKTNFD